MDDATANSYARPPQYRGHAEDDGTILEVFQAAVHAPPAERAAVWKMLRDHLETTRATPEDEAKHAQDRADAWKNAPSGRPSETADPMVYYIRFGDRVKIGHTKNLAARLKALPHDEVLATEPGPMALERARHQQFADLRVTGEWFRFEEPLIGHIASLV